MENLSSPNDRFAGWAKRMGELQAEATKSNTTGIRFPL